MLEQLKKTLENDNASESEKAKAFVQIQKLAEQGNSEAMLHLGNCYILGNGTARNYSSAVEWYQKSANLGNDRAMKNLGLCYEGGRGVAKDNGKAAEWYTKAAKLGNDSARNRLNRLNNIIMEEKNMEADTRFTALGLSGSGKTCYVLGMYHEMCVGVKGFTLTTENQTASRLDDWTDKLDEETGMDRFPVGTSLTDVSDYFFKLHYHNQPIMSFNWVDYGGGTLRAREDNPAAFESLEKSIHESTTLYIFIDGDLLCDDSQEKKIRNVKRKCAKTINPYINEFIQENGQEKLPPIVFVITKSDLCGRYTNKNDMIEILKESFSSVFGEENRTYIVAVSLGKDISDDNYSGDVEPINVHIPLFIGIYYDFLRYCHAVKYVIEKQEKENQTQITQNKREINYQKGRWFFTDYEQIEKSQRAIEEAENTIEMNKEILKEYKKLLGAVASELMRLSDNFICLEGEKEVNFNINDTYEL